MRTFVFHFHWNASHLSNRTLNTHTSNRTLHTDCYFLSSIGWLNLHLSTYMNLLCIEYHLFSVVIVVKLFANVFSYDPVSISSEEDLSETSSYTETTIEEFYSSVMLSWQTLKFSALKNSIVLSLAILMVITYILAFFGASHVNSWNGFFFL